MKFQHTWEEVENAGRLYNVEFSIDYTVTPYRKARINCDPDDAYPAEGGEVVINDIRVLSVEMIGVGKVKSTDVYAKISPIEKLYWTKRFEKEITEDFMIELAEHAAADDEAAREAEEDSRYDTMREERDGND